MARIADGQSVDLFFKEFMETHYLMTDPLIVDDSALQQLLGRITKTPYSEGVRQSLAAVHSEARVSLRAVSCPSEAEAIAYLQLVLLKIDHCQRRLRKKKNTRDHISYSGI